MRVQSAIDSHAKWVPVMTSVSLKIMKLARFEENIMSQAVTYISGAERNVHNTIAEANICQWVKKSFKRSLNFIER